MSAKLTREVLEALRDCESDKPCGGCILQPLTNRACHMVDIEYRELAALALRLAEALKATSDELENWLCDVISDKDFAIVEPLVVAARALLAELEG